MELALFIYLAGAFSLLKTMFTLLGSIVLTFTVVHTVNCYHNDTKVSKLYHALSVILLVIASLIPSEKTMYMMAGGYFAQEIITSETSSKVKALIDAKLDEYILELKTQKRNKEIE